MVPLNFDENLLLTFIPNSSFGVLSFFFFYPLSFFAEGERNFILQLLKRARALQAMEIKKKKKKMKL